ncbi:MAG: hypothetical protein H0U10_10585 [Chloroflexia bacterium]|nr:hypothetical protein [Chloroflexia bacterium]
MRLPSRTVSEAELRRRFNEGEDWLRTQSGELTAEVRRSGHPSPEGSGEPYCTQSQIVAYSDRMGRRVAVVHQYVRPDGTVGGSGRPDPKMVVEDDVEYRSLPPASSSAE